MIRESAMKHRFEITALFLFVLLFATGCPMTVEEYRRWNNYMLREADYLRKQNSKKEEEKAKLEAEQARKEEQKAFLIGKSEVLIRENARLDEVWDGMNNDSHEVMMNLFSRIHDSEMAFYDVRLGNPPMAMTTTMRSEKYTLLVDMEQVVQDDCQFQMAEIYTSAKTQSGMVCFVLLNKNEAGKYYVKSSTGFRSISSEGQNTFKFTDRPLDARKGDKYGIILSPGASIDYDEVDTGSVCVRKLDSVPEALSKLQVILDTPVKRGKTGVGSMEMALMLRGTSTRKSMVIVDARPFAEGKLLSKVVVNINTATVKPLPVYFAVLGKTVADGTYDLRDISEMTMVTPGEKTQEFVLKHYNEPEAESQKER